jgi:hypothetical protein
MEAPEVFRAWCDEKGDKKEPNIVGWGGDQTNKMVLEREREKGQLSMDQSSSSYGEERDSTEESRGQGGAGGLPETSI